jgi:phosphate acetyltransferase
MVTRRVPKASVAQGMWTAALVSAVLRTKLPGPGTIYLGQDLKFRKPVSPGDTITVTVRVKEKRAEKRILILETSCTNQSGREVLFGHRNRNCSCERN